MLQWIEASTLDELQSALVQGYRVIGGGTGLLGTENPVDKVVDIRRFPAANQIVDHPSHWQLGPVVTLAHLQAWAKTHVPGLAEGLDRLGTPVFRNLATIAGRLANRESASDLYPIMRLLGTEVLIVSREEPQPRWLPLEYEGPLYGVSRVWLALRIPRSTWHRRIVFEKFTKARLNGSIVNGAVSWQQSAANGQTQVQMVISGVFEVPCHLFVCANPPDLATKARAQWQTFWHMGWVPIDDFRASAAYRAHIAGVVLERLLKTQSGFVESSLEEA